MDYNISIEPNLSNQLNRIKYSLTNEIAFLPENFYETSDKQELIYPDSTSDLIKVFRENKIPSNLISESKGKYRIRKDATWIGPTILVSATLLYENHTLLTLALNVLSNYLTDLFKGSFGRRKAKFEIIIETKKNMKYKKISYEGNPEGIKDLIKVIKDIRK